MDSINQQQPEENHADLAGPDAARKIQDLAERAKVCFFCTSAATAGSSESRPMAVQKVDDQGALWFMSSVDSHKNEEVERDPVVHLYFQASAHTGFLSLTGTARVFRDRAMIEELWKPIMKTWFTGGIDDPRITVLRVTPTSGYYWDTKHGRAVAAAKMLLGAVLGQTLDDSIEGHLTFPSTLPPR